MKQKRSKTYQILVAVFSIAAVAIGYAILSLLIINVSGRRMYASERVVDLSNCGITDSSGLLRLKNPQSINLTGNSIEINNYEELRTAFPQCEILWDVPLSYGSFDANIAEIHASDYAESDLSAYAYFNNLSCLDMSDIKLSKSDYEKLKSVLPCCEIKWSIPIGDEYYPASSEQITIPGAQLGAEELADQLHQFEALSSVTVTDCSLTIEEQRSLMKEYPDISFLWDVEMLGTRYRTDIQEIRIENPTDKEISELCDKADMFTGINTIDFGDSVLDTSVISSVSEAFNGAAVACKFEFQGTTLSTMEATLDFSGSRFEDPYVWDTAVKVMPRLEAVDMCDCNLDNETMDMLNHRYEGVRFIWRVYLTREYPLRTDATNFCTSNRPNDGYIGISLTDEQVEPLKYCTDMIGIDLGHSFLTNINFVSEMKNLKYLVVSCNHDLSDISAIANCPELEYFEGFCTAYDDISPLLSCKKLKYLNIGTSGDKYDASPLFEMKSLLWLWYTQNSFSDEETEKLIASLPCLEDSYLSRSEKADALAGWKCNQGYYDMRDLFGMSW